MKDWFLRKFKLLISVLLLISLIPLAPVTLDARKRNKKANVRKQAIETIRSSSEIVSELAGLEPDIQEDTLTITDETCLFDEGEIPEELEEEDDITVDLETFKTLWLSFVSDDEDEEFTYAGVRKSEIMDIIMDWLGTRYRYGGVTARGIDCSAFMRLIYRETANIELPRTARVQWLVGDHIQIDRLEFGDLVFFHTRRRYYVSHVGIYLGDNLFAHASSRYGVTVSSLESKYYSKRFIGARRITPREIEELSRNKNQDSVLTSKN